MNKIRLLTFLLLAVFTSCSSLNGIKKTTSNIIGTWIYTETVVNENQKSEELEKIFLNSSITFNSDKSFENNVANMHREGTWSIGKGGEVLILGFENTQITENRLKTFKIIQPIENELIIMYRLDDTQIKLKFQKEN